MSVPRTRSFGLARGRSPSDSVKNALTIGAARIGRSACVRSCRVGRWRRWWRPTKRSGVCLSLSPSPLLRRLAMYVGFATPQQLMAFLGLVPSERTTDTVRRGSITKTGNHRARRVLIEGAWTYRFSARIGETLRTRLKDLPLSVRASAWKAQLRLCARLPSAHYKGQEDPCCDNGDRPRARCLPVAVFRCKLCHELFGSPPPW